MVASCCRLGGVLGLGASLALLAPRRSFSRRANSEEEEEEDVASGAAVGAAVVVLAVVLVAEVPRVP